MVSEVEVTNRMMLRARDAMDRNSEKDLDLATLAGIAGASRAHFVRTFKATFGETPHRYLQRARAPPGRTCHVLASQYRVIGYRGVYAGRVYEPRNV